MNVALTDANTSSSPGSMGMSGPPAATRATAALRSTTGWESDSESLSRRPSRPPMPSAYASARCLAVTAAWRAASRRAGLDCDICQAGPAIAGCGSSPARSDASPRTVSRAGRGSGPARVLVSSVSSGKPVGGSGWLYVAAYVTVSVVASYGGTKHWCTRLKRLLLPACLDTGTVTVPQNWLGPNAPKIGKPK
jgi:hypothetical protein